MELEKKNFVNSLYVTLDAFESKIFPRKIKVTGFSCKVLHNFNLKILTPKQMLQWLPTALAQVKAGKTSENLLNKIRQITKKYIAI